MQLIIRPVAICSWQTGMVTVSKNYAQEVSKKEFGYDFAELLDIRQKNGNFFGIVNGYDKKLIAPLAGKIERINNYFDGTKFEFYDEKNIIVKNIIKKNLSSCFPSWRRMTALSKKCCRW